MKIFSSEYYLWFSKAQHDCGVCGWFFKQLKRCAPGEPFSMK